MVYRLREVSFEILHTIRLSRHSLSKWWTRYDVIIQKTPFWSAASIVFWVYLFFGQTDAAWMDTLFGVALARTNSANWAQIIVYLLSAIQLVSCLVYVFVFVVTQSPVLAFREEIKEARRAKTSLGASELQARIMNNSQYGSEEKESRHSSHEPQPRRRRSIAGSVAAVLHSGVATFVPRKRALPFGTANSIHPSIDHGSAWGSKSMVYYAPSPDMQTDPENVVLAPRQQRGVISAWSKLNKKIRVLLTLLRSFYVYLLLVYVGSSLAGVLHHPYWFALHLLEFFRRPDSKMVLQVRPSIRGTNKHPTRMDIEPRVSTSRRLQLFGLQAITHIGPNLFKTALMAMICMIIGGAINFVLFADKMSCNTAFRCMVCHACSSTPFGCTFKCTDAHAKGLRWCF